MRVCKSKLEKNFCWEEERNRLKEHSFKCYLYKKFAVSQDYSDAGEQWFGQGWSIVLMLKTTLAKQFYICHICTSCKPLRLKVIGPKCPWLHIVYVLFTSLIVDAFWLKCHHE